MQNSLALGYGQADTDDMALLRAPVAPAAHEVATPRKDHRLRSGTPAHLPTALQRLLHAVAQSEYRFITPTPATHQRILARPARHAGLTLRDVFGWNLPFAENDLSAEIFTLMREADVLIATGGRFRSSVRIASLGNDLFLHSAFPTSQDDAVFFGPDTYRFARFIAQSLAADKRPAGGCRLLDIGCGSGAGAIAAARTLTSQAQDGTVPADIWLNDINPLALQFAAINAAQANIGVCLAPGDALNAVDGQFDLIISNPPYMDDGAQRAYRHGGARLGRALSVRIVAEALPRLAPGGTLLLYTGVAIVGGVDPFHAEVGALLATGRFDWSYGEIDPDVFGEELERPQYARAERIAAVGLVATRRRRPD